MPFRSFFPLCLRDRRRGIREEVTRSLVPLIRFLPLARARGGCVVVEWNFIAGRLLPRALITLCFPLVIRDVLIQHVVDSVLDPRRDHRARSRARIVIVFWVGLLSQLPFSLFQTFSYTAIIFVLYRVIIARHFLYCSLCIFLGFEVSGTRVRKYCKLRLKLCFFL